MSSTWASRVRFLFLIAAVTAAPLVSVSGSMAAPGVAAGAFVDSPAVVISEIAAPGDRATYYLAARHAGPGDDFQGTKVTVAKHAWDTNNPDYFEETTLPTEALTWSSYYRNYDGWTYPKLILNATLPTMGDFNLEFIAACKPLVRCAQEGMSTIWALEPSYWHIVSADYASHGDWEGTINGVRSRGYEEAVAIGRGATGFFEFPNTF